MRAYGLLTPSVIVLTTFTFWPTFLALYQSLFQHNLATPTPRFIGLGNFLALAHDPLFFQVMRNTVIFVGLTVPLSIGLALLLAVAVDGWLGARNWLRAAFFYPSLVPLVSAATIWLFLYTPQYGLLDQALRALRLSGVNWLGDVHWVLPSIVFMAVWKQSGYLMLFYLAGLQSLPRDLYEAAALEGASAMTVFRRITLPLLGPTTVFVVVVATTSTFQMVDQLYIMTQGGPDNASNLLLYHIYLTAFSFLDQGKAAALTVVLIAILSAVALYNHFVLDRKVFYQ